MNQRQIQIACVTAYLVHKYTYSPILISSYSYYLRRYGFHFVAYQSAYKIYAISSSPAIIIIIEIIIRFIFCNYSSRLYSFYSIYLFIVILIIFYPSSSSYKVFLSSPLFHILFRSFAVRVFSGEILLSYCSLLLSLIFISFFFVLLFIVAFCYN